MTTPKPPGTAFLTLPHMDVDTSYLHVSDRIADLDTAIVHLSLAVSMHVQSAAEAAAVAGAFIKAEQLLTEAGRP